MLFLLTIFKKIDVTHASVQANTYIIKVQIYRFFANNTTNPCATDIASAQNQNKSYQ